LLRRAAEKVLIRLRKHHPDFFGVVAGNNRHNASITITASAVYPRQNMKNRSIIDKPINPVRYLCQMKKTNL